MRDPKTGISKISETRAGFTLVEIMVTIAIIGILATIATPNLLRARQYAMSGRVSNDMKVYREAIDVYHFEHSKYPNAAQSLLPGTFPSDLADGQYIEPDTAMRYEETVPLVGGNYQFDKPAGGSYTAAIVIANTPSTDPILELIDKHLDDENLAAGKVQKIGTNLVWIIE